MSYRIPIYKNYKNSLEFVRPFYKPAINSHPLDPESIKPTDCREAAFTVVELPVIDRPFGGRIMIGSHCSHDFAFNNQLGK